MSDTGSSSTAVQPNTDVELTSSSEESKPTYVLGQKVPGYRAESPVTQYELANNVRESPYIIVLDKPNGKRRFYIGIVGDLVMVDETITEVNIILTPRKVVKVTPDRVFNVWCDVAYPRGYSRRGRNGKIRFSITRIMRSYHAMLDAADAAGGN